MTEETLEVGEQVEVYNPELLRRFGGDAVVATVIADTPACYILEVTFPRHADGEQFFKIKSPDEN